MQKPESIADTVVAMIMLGEKSRQLADRLRDHKRGADHRSAAALHAIEAALRDFAAAIGHAEAGMSLTLRAAITQRQKSLKRVGVSSV
jgi:hypothetical protein